MSVEPLAVIDPLAWWRKNSWDTPGPGQRVDEGEDDQGQHGEDEGPAEVGEHQSARNQYACRATRIRSISLMKTNGTMIPPTP